MVGAVRASCTSDKSCHRRTYVALDRTVGLGFDASVERRELLPTETVVLADEQPDEVRFGRQLRASKCDEIAAYVDLTLDSIRL